MGRKTERFAAEINNLMHLIWTMFLSWEERWNSTCSHCTAPTTGLQEHVNLLTARRLVKKHSHSEHLMQSFVQ